MTCSFLLRSTPDESGNANVLDGRELGKKVMKLENKSDVFVPETGQSLVVELVDLGPVNKELSLVGTVEGPDDVEEGGFPGSRGSYDAHDLLLGNMQVDAFEDFELAVRLMNACRLNHTLIILAAKIGIFLMLASVQHDDGEQHHAGSHPLDRGIDRFVDKIIEHHGGDGVHQLKEGGQGGFHVAQAIII